MAMLKKRRMIQYLIHNLPKTIGRQNGKSGQYIDSLMDEMQYLYEELRVYDVLISYMTNIRKVGI